MSSTSTTTALVTVESPPHSVKSDSSLHFSEGSDSGHHESSNAGSSQPSTPRTGSHYREVEQEIEMEEEELLEENDDHDSGILGELQTEADSYSSSSDSGYGLTASNQRYANYGIFMIFDIDFDKHSIKIVTIPRSVEV